jgi:hypothetical protein
MKKDRVEKILDELRKKLLSDALPDDATGSFTFHTQSGGLSGKLEMKLSV